MTDIPTAALEAIVACEVCIGADCAQYAECDDITLAAALLAERTQHAAEVERLRVAVRRYRVREEALLVVLLNDGHAIDELNTRLAIVMAAPENTAVCEAASGDE